MQLKDGGMDIFYIDESNDKNIYIATAIAIPFLRQIDGVWHLLWTDYLEKMIDWRRGLAQNLRIPKDKELHGTKLARGRGNYLDGIGQIPPDECAAFYQKILCRIDFLLEASVISVAGTGAGKIFNLRRLERVMLILFQRMRRQCVARNVNAMVFFDEGHPEYRSLYRRSMKNLPTGSTYGGMRNLPLDMFVKDGNNKNSRHCQFTQLADLIAYAALCKIRHEQHLMPEKDIQRQLHRIYESLPPLVRNSKVSARGDGLVWLDGQPL